MRIPAGLRSAVMDLVRHADARAGDSVEQSLLSGGIGGLYGAGLGAVGGGQQPQSSQGGAATGAAYGGAFGLMLGMGGFGNRVQALRRLGRLAGWQADAQRFSNALQRMKDRPPAWRDDPVLREALQNRIANERSRNNNNTMDYIIDEPENSLMENFNENDGVGNGRYLLGTVGLSAALLSQLRQRQNGQQG